MELQNIYPNSAAEIRFRKKIKPSAPVAVVQDKNDDKELDDKKSKQKKK